MCVKLHTVYKTTHFRICVKLHTFCKTAHFVQYQSSFFHISIGNFTLDWIFLHNQRLWWLWQIWSMPQPQPQHQPQPQPSWISNCGNFWERGDQWAAAAPTEDWRLTVEPVWPESRGSLSLSSGPVFACLWLPIWGRSQVRLTGIERKTDRRWKLRPTLMSGNTISTQQHY